MRYANVHIIECADGKKAPQSRENAGRRVSWDLRLVVCRLLICLFHHHPQPLSASTTIGQLPPWAFMTDCVGGVPVERFAARWLLGASALPPLPSGPVSAGSCPALLRGSGFRKCPEKGKREKPLQKPIQVLHLLASKAS